MNSSTSNQVVLIATANRRLATELASELGQYGGAVALCEDGAEVLEWLEVETRVPGSLRVAVIDDALPVYPAHALAACVRANHLPIRVILVGRDRVAAAAANDQTVAAALTAA